MGVIMNNEKAFEIKSLSDITYSLEEHFTDAKEDTVPAGWKVEGNSKIAAFPNGSDKSFMFMGGSRASISFEPVSGKITASVAFRLKVAGKGKNVMTLYSDKGEKAISIICEGMYLVAYDGKIRRKLCDYKNDCWFSLWVSLNTISGKYDVFVDGTKYLSGAAFVNTVDNIAIYEAGSIQETLFIKRVFIYRNPVQSVLESDGIKPVYDVKEMGIEADGQTVVTEKIQKIIDECSMNGGGIVYLRAGTYLSGMIELKEKVRFYIENDATLKGVLDWDAYPTMVSKYNPNWNMIKQGPQKALIYADGVMNLVIEGGGTIDGSGDFIGDYGSESSRPSGILLVGCNNASIHDIYVKDAGMWTIPLIECDNFYMRDVNISSYWFPNRDAIDICDCHNILVENCYFKSDDDTVCFKSGNDRGCNNVLVRNMMIISTMANAIKYGTYSYGGFSNCTVEDCIVKDTRLSAMCVEVVDGGEVKNLQFNRITVKDAGSAFFIILGDRGNIPFWGTRRIGSIEDIYFNDIKVERLTENNGSYISGLKIGESIYPLKNINFTNVNAAFMGGMTQMPQTPPEYSGSIYPESTMYGGLPASAYFLRHIEGITYNNCDTVVSSSDVRDVKVCNDVWGLEERS